MAMEYNTYFHEGNVLALSNDIEILVFKWTGKECIVARCDFALNGYDVDYTYAKIVFAWETSNYNLEEVQKALYKITSRAFSYTLDEDYDPIFTEWSVKAPISVSYYYEALYEEFNK